MPRKAGPGGWIQCKVEAIRINCAYDGPEQWAQMIALARAANRKIRGTAV